MQTTKGFSRKKVRANLEKEVCVFFKVKNKLGKCVCWCEIKLKLQRAKMSLSTTNGKISFLFF